MNTIPEEIQKTIAASEIPDPYKSIVTEQKPLAYSIYNLKDLPEINLNFN